MKKNFVFLFIAVLFMCSCQTKTEPKIVDTEAEKAVVDSLFIKLHTAMNTKDLALAKSVIKPDALTCGTDPSEFTPVKEWFVSLEKAFADTSLHIQYQVDKRVIQISPDGESAVIIEQYMMPVISKRIQIRSIQHAVKQDSKWMIDFLSWNFIPKNEEIAVIDKALEMPVAAK